MTSHEQLGRLVISGVSNGIFYPRYKDQIRRLLPAAWEVEPVYLGRTALAARLYGTPAEVAASLLAVLYQRDPRVFEDAMLAALDGVEMVRAYAWAARSGISGRKLNLSNAVHRRVIQSWFDTTPAREIVAESGGPDFGLLNALRCARVKGHTKDKQALLSKLHRTRFGYTHSFDEEYLPEMAPSDPSRAIGPYRAFLESGEIGEEWEDDYVVPTLKGQTVVAVDVSFSMSLAVRQHGRVTCLEAAAVVGSAIARRNKARILAFRDTVIETEINPRDTVSTNATKLVGLVKGGTDPAAPLRWLNQRGDDVDNVVILGDEDACPRDDLLEQWLILRSRCPQAKLYCIDFAPPSNQAREPYEGVLQMAGFSDQAFFAMQSFAHNDNPAERIDRIDFGE